jgi:hypothetical protein
MDESNSNGETHWYKFGAVQVYARRDAAGRVHKADAIDEECDQIRGLADQLQNAGYGVLRERVSRSGRVYYRMRALWAGPGDPPLNPPGSA